jgi:PAS domain S-box-containing protein
MNIETMEKSKQQLMSELDAAIEKIKELETILGSTNDSAGNPIEQQLGNVADDFVHLQNSDLFKCIFYESKAVKFIVNPETGKIDDANYAAERFYGFSRQELLAKNISDINRLSKEEVKSELDNAASKAKGTFDFRHLIASGEVRDVKVYSSPINVGQLTRLYSTIIDVTEQKKAESDLIESEERFRALMMQSPLGIAIFSPDGLLESINTQFSDTWGLSPEVAQQAIGKYNIRHSDRIVELGFKNIVESVFSGGGPDKTPPFLSEINKTLSEFDIGSSDTRILWIQSSYYPIKNSRGELINVILINHDITERKIAEEALRKSEEDQRILLNNINTQVWYLTGKHTYGAVNKAHADFLGMSIEELEFKDMFDIFPSEIVLICEVGNGLVFDTKQILETEEWSPHYSGGQRLLSIIKTPILDEDGEVEYVVCAAEDITEQRQNKERLVFEKERNQLYLDTAGTMMIALDVNQQVTLVNPRGCQVLGYSKEEIIGKNWFDNYIPGEDTKAVKEVYNKLIMGEIEPVEYYENAIINKSGELRTIAWHNAFLRNKNGEVLGLISSGEDITDKIKADAELQKISKLETLGVLSGGIAHNFKNILADISFKISLAKYKPENTMEYLEKMDAAVAQASSIATRFQTFSKGGDPIIEPVSLQTVIDDVFNIALSGSEIIHQVESSENLWNALADSKQLNELFMNLIINAKQAVNQTGNIQVELNNAVIDKGHQTELPPGDYVLVSIKDNGVGIAEDKLSKIFEPFYTNKVKGTGLGLSSVLMIVQKHKGTILVDSVIDCWTRFDVYLPASKTKIESEQVQEEKLVKGDNNRILFVDDDESILENLEEMGELINYRIEPAGNSCEAISKYTDALDSDDPYSMVVLDLTLQGSKLQGDEILINLQNIDPLVKAIVFSGHSAKPIVANYKEFGFVGRLDKPITLEKLGLVLKDIQEKF